MLIWKSSLILEWVVSMDVEMFWQLFVKDSSLQVFIT